MASLRVELGHEIDVEVGSFRGDGDAVSFIDEMEKGGGIRQQNGVDRFLGDVGHACVFRRVAEDDGETAEFRRENRSGGRFQLAASLAFQTAPEIVGVA